MRSKLPTVVLAFVVMTVPAGAQVTSRERVSGVGVQRAGVVHPAPTGVGMSSHPAFRGPAIWAGVSVGVHGSLTDTSTRWEGLGRIDRSDWRGGAHLGWLTQQGPWVWGIEGDVDTGRSALTLAGAGTADLGASATLRAKAGIALGDWLPYVTAGIAVARPAVTPLGGLTNHDWRLGHALGAGLAWRFSPNLSLRGEVLHVGFGDVDTGVGKVRLDETRVRAGVTWHFN